MAYDDTFMAYTSSMNEKSARIITSLLYDHFKPSSVIDFGCAQGGWLKAWQDNGVADLQGLDGDYVNVDKLLIDKDFFKAVDISKPINLNKKFDIAQCIEVAEHLPQSSAATLVESLTRHAPLVIFSAAPPGQGGRGHLNEQPYAYWRDLFAQHHFLMLDWIRPKLLGNYKVQPWYRYNIFIFANKALSNTLPDNTIRFQVSNHGDIPDISPALYQARKKMVNLIPPKMQNHISDIIARYKQ